MAKKCPQIWVSGIYVAIFCKIVANIFHKQTLLKKKIYFISVHTVSNKGIPVIPTYLNPMSLKENCSRQSGEKQLFPDLMG